MRWTPGVLGVGLICGLACTCGTTDILPPEKGAARAEPVDPPRSTVTVPVMLTTELLRSRVVEQIPKTLVDEKKKQLERGVVADILAERSGEPTVRTGSGLRIDVPIRFEVVPRASRLGSLKLGTVTGEMKVTVALQPEIDDHWTLVPNPEVTYSWIDEPVLKVGPFKVGIRAVAERGLDQQITQVERNLRRELPDTIDLRGKVREAWTQLGQPKQINTSPETWVSFAPDALFADPIVSTKAGLQLTVGAAGTLAVAVGSAPKSTSRPLPDRKPAPADSGARIAASIRVPWRDIRAALREQVVDQAVTRDVPGIGTVELAVTKIVDVYASGRSIAVGLTARATAAGTDAEVELWLAGRPTLQGDTLRINDPEHVARTSSSWFDSIHASIADDLEALVADRLVVDLSTRRSALIAQLDRDLATRPSEEGITIDADVIDARLKRVYPTDDALVVDAVARGTLAITVHSAPSP